MLNVEVEAKEIVEDVPVVMSTEGTNNRLPQIGRAITFRFEFKEPSHGATTEQGVSQGSCLPLMQFFAVHNLQENLRQS